MQAFVNIWSEFDPEATGFIAITNLNMLIKRLAEDKESYELVILADEMRKSVNLRREFICFLDIPLYD